MPSLSEERLQPSRNVIEFVTWASKNEVFMHPSLDFVPSQGGHNVYAKQDIPRDTRVLSCPFQVAITAPQSKSAIAELFHDVAVDSMPILDKWSERQLVCVYLVLHRIWEESKHRPLPPACRHEPYLNMLPAPAELLTPLYFSEVELSLLEGSNLHPATLKRRQEWQAEWSQCTEGLSAIDSILGSAFTWDHYLAASTYLSSRAFPSTLLSESPTNTSPESSHAVLLPGIDSLNHRRAMPVSWVATMAKDSGNTAHNIPHSDGRLDLLLHDSIPAGTECFNNYGPKPNSELILGYGFALPSNPDDTILLSLAASNSTQADMVEIGRNAKNATHLWDLVVSKLSQLYQPDEEDGGGPSSSIEPSWELELEAAETIIDLTENKLVRLPDLANRSASVRPSVVDMVECYIEGQRAILTDLVEWAQSKHLEAQDKAKAEGIDLVLDDDISEEASE
ncbi:SET domain-containing protein [Ceratobasidium sp. AG-I]|nr:SET domain-containing protein [Ceratobasidium sp. AG-I]